MAFKLKSRETKRDLKRASERNRTSDLLITNQPLCRLSYAGLAIYLILGFVLYHKAGFADNKKANPMQMVLPNLFSFFSNLMLFHYLPQKTAEAAASEFKIHPFIAKNYVKAAQTFNAWKTIYIIGYLREADARSKGFQSAGIDDKDLYKELIFKILH